MTSGAAKGEILMIVHRIPYPPDKGDKIRSFNQLKFLAERGWQVHLCTLADDPDDMKHVGALLQYCASVQVEPLSPGIQKLRSLVAPLSGRPMSACYFYNARLQQKVDELLLTRPVKAVFCFCSPMAEYLLRSRQRPLIDPKTREVSLVMDMVDIDSDKWDQYARRSTGPMKWLYLLEGRLLRRYERQVADFFDATLLVSGAEAESFRQRAQGCRGIVAVSNGVDHQYFHAAFRESDGRKRISFCGAMGYLPNVDAVRWFALEVLPRIREALGEVEFWIVGGGAGEEVWSLEKLPGVHVTGRVEDVRPYVWDSDLSVAPIRIARGIQNKVLEAMSMGIPALVTPQAFEGLEAVAGVEVGVSVADPDTFAAAAVELLSDPEKGRAMARRARQTVLDRYSWTGRLQMLDRILEAPGIAGREVA